MKPPPLPPVPVPLDELVDEVEEDDDVVDEDELDVVDEDELDVVMPDAPPVPPPPAPPVPVVDVVVVVVVVVVEPVPAPPAPPRPSPSCFAQPPDVARPKARAQAPSAA
jgi:hypothetical protein